MVSQTRLITHPILYIDEMAGKTKNVFYLSRLLLNLKKNKDKKQLLTG